MQGRIVYPADLVDGAPYEEEPYLPYGMESAKAFINFGAPDILKRIPYILFHWTLVKLDAVRNAPVLPVARTLKKEKFPIVICSHGNGGTREVSSAIHHVSGPNCILHAYIINFRNVCDYGCVTEKGLRCGIRI